MTAVNSKDIIRRLEREGWIRCGGKGDHAKYQHPQHKLHVVVPHPRKALRIGTLRNIYRQAGWPWKE